MLLATFKKLTLAEWEKVRHYPVFWLVLAFYAFIFLLGAISWISWGSANPDLRIHTISMFDYMAFPSVWNTFTWGAKWINLLLGLLAVMLVTQEYSLRTFRQQVIDGSQRWELLAGKGILIAALATAVTLFIVLCGIVFGLIYTKNLQEVEVFENFYPVFGFWLQCIFYMSIGLFFGILIRRVAIGLIINVLYFFPLEIILRNILFYESSELYFFPYKIAGHLTPLPELIDSIIKMSENMAGVTSAAHPTYGSAIAVTLLYVAAFWTASYLLIKRRNL